ncbi:MAG: hypothetical protein PWQ67_1799 [Clostridia bacterium]|jgi:hypothetical protein|nr:hypothetical protein [Clostridia bacterium]MDN5323345.1 hypothetical protein [Clostridia bacterium]
MQDLKLEVILFSDENAKYNRDADILAQFLNELRNKYPQMIIHEYDGDKMEKLFQYIDIDYYQNNYPIFILNGKIVSSEGIPDIKEIENYIEEFA